MRRFLACALLGLAGCGWQPAGSVAPTFSALISVSVHVGHSVTIALAPVSPGAARTASSATPTIASAAIDARGNLVIDGIASGTTTVTERDSAGTVTTNTQTYSVTVSP